MAIPTRQERLDFWKHAYARASFADAQVFIREMLKMGLSIDSPLRKAFSVAFITTYGRPFKQLKEVRTTIDNIPPNFRTLHNEIILWRDKVVAHRDIAAPSDDWGFVNQLEFVVEGPEVAMNTSSIVLSDQKATEIVPLLDALIAALDEKILAFGSEHFEDIVHQSGTHILCLKEGSANWTQRVR